MASKNVAAQKVIVKIRTRLGSAVSYGWSPAKVISISETNVILRPMPEERQYDMPKVRIPIKEGKRADYTGGWVHYTEVDTEGWKRILALHKELFPGVSDEQQ